MCMHALLGYVCVLYVSIHVCVYVKKKKTTEPSQIIMTLSACAEGVITVLDFVCVCDTSLHAAKGVYTSRWIYQLALC